MYHILGERRDQASTWPEADTFRGAGGAVFKLCQAGFIRGVNGIALTLV